MNLASTSFLLSAVAGAGILSSLHWSLPPALASSVPAVFAGPTSAEAQTATPCDDWLLPPRVANNKKVGPSSCLMQETAVTFEGRPFTRLDIGLDGTVEGYLTKTGDYKEYLTNSPDLVFPQTADPGPILFGVARYERDKGASMTLVLPARESWNGKMWVTAHGRGVSFKQGNLRPWNKNGDPANPLNGLDEYDQQMLAKGFVLAKTRRTSAEGLGEIITTLEDGTTVDYAAFNDSARYVMDFGAVAGKAVAARLGRAPTRTYLWGHSAGARIARGINYTPGLNKGTDGRPVFDGFLIDDAAAGGWLPVRYKDGKDVLFTTEADKAAMVPQVEVIHQMYNNIWPSKKPDYMSASYLANKRANAKILRDKGLTSKYRSYEVRAVSHSGRGGGLHLKTFMDRFLDMLDAWADKGVAPPPTRSDWAPVGDANGDGVIELPALTFPEAACPLGVYYPTTSTSGSTAIAAFSGEGLEPLDRGNVFVDMNRNGVWDMRETPTQAWQRLGLLKKGEQVTREKYVECIETAARALVKDGFISDASAKASVEQARTADLQPKDPVTPPGQRGRGRGGN
jgi:hypothetical protein